MPSKKKFIAIEEKIYVLSYVPLHNGGLWREPVE
jgi:hypothetical protein